MAAARACRTANNAQSIPMRDESAGSWKSFLTVATDQRRKRGSNGAGRSHPKVTFDTSSIWKNPTIVLIATTLSSRPRCCGPAMHFIEL
jgi:hypothetical protein